MDPRSDSGICPSHAMARSPNRHKRPASEEPQTSSTHPDQTRPRPRRRRLDHSDFELPVPGHNFAVVIDPPRRKQESRADGMWMFFFFLPSSTSLHPTNHLHLNRRIPLTRASACE